MQCLQVLKALERAGLSIYCEVFYREQISGFILAELDESTLESDLGVSSRLHRIRLMNIIAGLQSV